MLLNAAPSARLVRSTPSSAFRSAAAVAAPRAPGALSSSSTSLSASPSSLRSSAPAARGSSVVVRASFAGYPDPDFIAETLEKFPEAMIANVEEARVLFTEGGYTYLDVRPEYELDEAGKVRGCVNVPVYNAENKYDAAAGKKVLRKFPNDEFLAQVEKKIPNKETKLIVACSDGKSYCMEALEALDEAGYENMVALKGGYYAWFRTWDNNLRRRRGDGYTEAYDGEGSDSCGVHATGAGFERMDAVEKWSPPVFDYVE